MSEMKSDIRLQLRGCQIEHPIIPFWKEAFALKAIAAMIAHNTLQATICFLKLSGTPESCGLFQQMVGLDVPKMWHVLLQCSPWLMSRMTWVQGLDQEAGGT